MTGGKQFMSTPEISIIIPVFNAEKYIVRCLESIENQSYRDYEVIIVNDGSTDSSLSIISEFARNKEYIKIVNQKNRKAAAARNTGIENAIGQYIAFIDSDDYVHADYLRVLYENAVKYDAEVSTCGFYKSSSEIFCDVDTTKNMPYVRSNIEVMYECCDINKTAIVTPWSKIYKKELFSNILYPEGRTYEDLAVTHRVLYRAKRIVTTELKLYCYFNTEESVVHGKYTYLNFYSENKAQDERLSFFAQLGIPDLDKKNMIAVERNRITNYCRGMLYLKCEKECKELKDKFNCTFKALCKKYKISLCDYALFWGFQKFTGIYVHLLYRLYLFYDEKIKRK